MKKPFEHYLAFIEDKLGCTLLNWQKRLLEAQYDGRHIRVSFGRQNGVTIYCKAVLELHKLLTQQDDYKEN